MLDCELFGLDAGRHHLISMLFHGINALFLFVILRRMTGAIWPSAFVAILFAVHPTHVESVAWVSERKDVLSTFFWILTMWSYFLWIRNGGVLRYVSVVLVYTLGLMAKPMLVTLPFVLLLLDYWPLGRIKFRKSELRNESSRNANNLSVVMEKVPLFLLAAMSSTITLFAQQKGGAISSLDAIPFDIRLTNALASHLAYIGKAVWPVKLAVFYPHPGVPALWKIIGGLLLVAGVSWIVTMKSRKWPYLGVGWFWYLGTLVPVIGLVQVGSQALADRYTYVPFIGIFIMVSWGVPRVLGRWDRTRILIRPLAALVVLVFTLTAWKQVQYWNNDISLFRHALDVTPDNYFAHNNIGYTFAANGKVEEAIHHYSEALRISPDMYKAHYNLANALVKKSEFEEAVRHYLEALRMEPNDDKIHYNLGNVLARQGMLDRAIKHYFQALETNPNHWKAQRNLACAFAEEGRTDEAIYHFYKVIRLRPGDWQVHFALGEVLLRKGNAKKAVEHLREALRINPRNDMTRRRLNEALDIERNH
jgi:Flp pilus assembly protein TadD